MTKPSPSSRSRLVVISAPSGTGKTTLCARLLKDFPELHLSVSTTTRAPRGQEKNGIEYFFVTREDFQKKIESGRFAEWAEVHSNFYGTSKDYIEHAFVRGESLLLDIDVQGADLLKRSYPRETLRVFISPPSMEELERRLRARGTETEESIQERLRATKTEMEAVEHFDYVIINDDFEKAYFQLAGIVSHSIRGTVFAKGQS